MHLVPINIGSAVCVTLMVKLWISCFLLSLHSLGKTPRSKAVHKDYEAGNSQHTSCRTNAILTRSACALILTYRTCSQKGSQPPRITFCNIQLCYYGKLEYRGSPNTEKNIRENIELSNCNKLIV